MEQELASREGDGILVRLVWDAAGDRVLVEYRDDRTGDAFEAVVPKSEALTAFEHPNVFRRDRSLVAA